MDVIYNVIEYGATTFDAISPLVFLTILFGRKQTIKPSVFYVCAFALALIDLIAVFMAEGTDFVQTFLMDIIEWSFAVFLLNGKMWKKLVYVLIYDIILTITNMMLVYGIVYIFSVEMEELFQIGTPYRLQVIFFHKIIIMLILVCILLLIRKHKIQFREWMLALCGYLAISIAGIAVIQYTKRHPEFEDANVEFLFWIMVALIALIAVFTICIYHLEKQYHYKLENELLNAKLKEEKHMLQKINEMYEDNQILRHDLKRYLTVAQGMARNNEMENLQRYLEEVLGEQFEAYQLYHTNSSVINAVLNDKANICKKNHIAYKVTVSGNIGEHWQVELGIILSNLLDNAIETENQEEQKEIDLQLMCDKNMLRIRVTNYITDSVLKDNPELKTSKKDSAGHGIGLKSVKKMVKKMDGIYSCEEQGSYFVTTIVLPDYAHGA